MRKTLFLVLVLFGAPLIASACGGDSTGPSKSSVAGTWTFAITGLSGGGLTCSGTGMEMSLAMTGDNAFSGSHTQGTITCSANGQSVTDQFASGPILNGTLTGTTVAFDFDDASFHFTGTLNTKDQTMSGAATTTSNGATMSGTWTANFKPAATASIAALPVAPVVPQGSLRQTLFRLRP